MDRSKWRPWAWALNYRDEKEIKGDGRGVIKLRSTVSWLQ